MDVKIRENLKDWIIESSRRYGMDDIIYSSFVLQMGYKHQYSAADMVWCITAFLEYDCGDFLKALDVLTKGNLELVNEGLALAKQQQMAIVNQVHTFIDTHQVVCAGPFIYAYVAEGTPHAKWFSNPNTLGRLVRYLRETWTAINKKSRDYPFIVCSPKDQLYGTCVTVGIPPFADDSHKRSSCAFHHYLVYFDFGCSEFHNAFKMAADRIKIEVQFSYFDSSGTNECLK
jgi:cell division control protein 45